MARAGSTEAAARILDDFARATGLEGDAPARRYLWTDAFAVCTCLSLLGRTGEARHLDRAVRLVDQVHHVLGRHRPDDPRSGWISGLPEEDGEQHPTLGGLRIGKPLPERGVRDPHDAQLEWDRDGQYFHYLTKWMHALHRLSLTTRETRHHRWAAELARVAHARFTHGPPGARRMVWKMSIDLTRALVPSMGQHDPLDGLVTLLTLQSSPARDPAAPDLQEAVAELDQMCAGRSWATADPLGIGGLLGDALRVAELVSAGAPDRAGLLTTLCDEAVPSLAAYARGASLSQPVEHRLPFRELGLALGLHAVERLRDGVESGALDATLRPAVGALAPFVPLAAVVEDMWLAPAHRRSPSWTEHEDINAVTLAASLAPEGFLGPGLGAPYSAM